MRAWRDSVCPGEDVVLISVRVFNDAIRNETNGRYFLRNGLSGRAVPAIRSDNARRFKEGFPSSPPPSGYRLQRNLM